MPRRYLFRRRRPAEIVWSGLRLAGAAATLAALVLAAAAAAPEPAPDRQPEQQLRLEAPP